VRRDELFERLAPPPGGLDRLRERPRFAGRAWPLLAAAALAAVVLVVVVLGWPPSGGAADLASRARSHVDTSEIALGLAALPPERVAVADEARSTTALAEVPTHDPRVSFYWVASTEGEP
jgi:hypothetical protein